MVNFTRHILPNGLRVLVHEDANTPLVAVNTLYYVGSRDEQSEKTGFAHLFEHLMFAGSKNVQDFDEPLQNAGGENNAYTTNDYTTFYEILPAENLETALWLESDRMLSLRISQKTLDVQRKVVVEEFKETCLNEPYGDSWHHLSEMMFQVHPYRWPVIGLSPEHIEQAVLPDVRDFYRQWYSPNNAVLSIAGNIKTPEVLELVEKWFADVPQGPTPERWIPAEPRQKAPVRKVIQADVPVPAVFLCFRTPPRLHPDFYPMDFLSDILGNGASSRLYLHLLKEQRLFSSIDAFVTANFDPGLLVIEGKLNEGVTPDAALDAIWLELNKLRETQVDERELNKIRHRFESTLVYSEISILNKAQNLGYYEALDKAELMNDETAHYLAVSADDLQRSAIELFRPDNSGSLIYVPR